MKLVVDTNVILSALIRTGKSREILLTSNLDLYVPEYFLKELKNNFSIIKEKTKLGEKKLKILLNLLLENIEVVPEKEFKNSLSEAQKTIGDIDPNDVPFLALALHLNSEIWSDDKDFKKQSKIKIWNTTDLLKYLGLI